MNINKLLLTLCGTSAIFASAPAVFGATVTGVGGDAENALEWRSSNIAKSFDADGDNVYGTAGYGLYYTEDASYGGPFKSSGTSPLGHPDTLTSIPSYLDFSDYFQNRNVLSSTYPELDDPTLAPGTDVADVKTGYATRVTAGEFMMRIEIRSGAPSEGLRFGFIAPNSGNDAVTSIELRGVGSADGTTDSFSTITGSDNLTIYFFDVTGYDTGDEFQLVMDDADGIPTYAGFTVDVIPEPGSFALLSGIFALSWIALRRRAHA